MNVEMKKPAAPPDAPRAERVPPRRATLRADFRTIRGAVVALVASLLFSAGLVGVSSALLDKWRDLAVLRKKERAQEKTRLSDAQVERHTLLEFQPAFEELRRVGLVGEENRLDLMELLRRIQEARELLPLTYTVASQRSFVVDPAVPTGAMDLRGSKISLSIPLLHEMDLLNLLGDLRSQGLYVPSACVVWRADRLTSEPLAARLKADCTLYWITMAQRKDAPPAEPPADPK